MERTARELAELRDPAHPRKELSPMGELAMADVAVEAQRHAEHRCVELCDAHVIPDNRGVGTPPGRPGPPPIDDGVERVDLGRGLLRELEHPDVDL